MKTLYVKKHKRKHNKSLKHNKKHFKGAGNCSYNNSRTCRNEPVQTPEPQTSEQIIPESLQPQLEPSEPIIQKNNIDKFNELINFLKKYHATYYDEIEKKELYENKILSILNDEKFDLSYITNQEDQFNLLFNVLKSYNNNILKAYIKLPNPNITEKNMLDIIEKRVDSPANSLNLDLYQFTDAVNMMKQNKENFPNIKNFLEDKLNIADTFTSEDSPKIIDLLNIYNKIHGAVVYVNSRDLNNSRDLIEMKQMYYSNTIASILNNPQFDLSKINEEDQFKLLFNVMKSYNKNILTAYTTIPNPYITEKNIMDIIELIRVNNGYANSSNMEFYEFTYAIDKMKREKANFPNIKNFLEDKLNIVDTFTSQDTPKIIDMINIYNKIDGPIYNVDLRNLNEIKKIYYKNTIISILNNPQFDLSKMNEEDKFKLLLYIIQTDNDKITDTYLKLRNTGLTEKMIKRAESRSSTFLFNKIKPKLENKLMKIKAHEEPIMQAEFLTAWKPSGQPLPKELQFNTLSYLQPKSKPTPSGITHDDFMGNAIQYAIDNPKIESDNSNSSSNALGGRRRKSRKLRKSIRRNTVRRK